MLLRRCGERVVLNTAARLLKLDLRNAVAHETVKKAATNPLLIGSLYELAIEPLRPLACLELLWLQQVPAYKSKNNEGSLLQFPISECNMEHSNT